MARFCSLHSLHGRIRGLRRGRVPCLLRDSRPAAPFALPYLSSGARAARSRPTDGNAASLSFITSPPAAPHPRHLARRYRRHCSRPLRAAGAPARRCPTSYGQRGRHRSRSAEGRGIGDEVGKKALGMLARSEDRSESRTMFCKELRN